MNVKQAYQRSKGKAEEEEPLNDYWVGLVNWWEEDLEGSGEDDGVSSAE